MRALLACFLFASKAYAYLPPADFVVSHAVSERSGLKSLEWTAKVTDVHSNSVFKEWIRLDFQAGRYFAVYTSPSDEPLGSVQAPMSQIHLLGKFWITVTLDPSMARVKEALNELRVLPAAGQEVRLGKINHQVTWSWGEEARIQVEKDEFNPIEYSGSTSNSVSDGVLFRSFASASARAKVPKSVLIKVQGGNAYEFELKSIKADSPSKEKVSIEPLRQAAVKEWISLVR